MKVNFWGVRGSIASPLVASDVKEKLRKVLNCATPKDIIDSDSIENFLDTLPMSLVGTYGSNTTCVEIRTAKNEIIIIDAGTGLRPLGIKLMKENFASGTGVANFIFTHTHWDHIQGIPFFLPFYIPNNVFHIHSIHENLETRLRYQHNPAFFPVSFDQLLATKYFNQHNEETLWKIGDVQISQIALRHPGVSYAFSFIENGKKVIFCSDAEFSLEIYTAEDLTKYIQFFESADLLIFDSQYTFEEQIQKIDWGHSSSLMATDMAMKSNVKKLVLFHHDPAYSDEKLDDVYLHALEYKKILQNKNKSNTEILIASEGMSLDV